MTEKMSGFLSFHPEEQSLGVTGDTLFLDIRHRIMTADFGPGSYFTVADLANKRRIDVELSARVARALQCHGYVTDLGAGRYQVKGWSHSEFVEALERLRVSQRSIAQKYSQQISDLDRGRLAACLAFRVSMSPDAAQIEAFYIRWWMFFHCTLHAYGMQSFRTLTLTVTSPLLRRRLITALPAELLNATFDGLQNLSAAFDRHEGSAAATLVDSYMDRVSPILCERNDRYNEFRTTSEIDYKFEAISGRPVFLSERENAPDISRGFREPLNWDQFVALGIDRRFEIVS